MLKFDVVVIGAGAAGMMCAAVAGQGGKKVALLDHSEKLGEKIRISGGGRCNFTNLSVTETNFVSENPRYARSALGRYTPAHFVDLVKSHNIAFHEKHKGQLFCDHKSDDIIHMLASECQQGNVNWFRPHGVQAIAHNGSAFLLETTAGAMQSQGLVIATGGLPVPKIGATDFGLHVAKQFGHKLVDHRPALVPLTFDVHDWAPFADLAGVSLPVLSRGGEHGAPWFDEDLLFTHRGLSGPAILQASTFWSPGQALHISLSKAQSTQGLLAALLASAQRSKASPENWLATQLPALPKRLLAAWFNQPHLLAMKNKKLAEIGKKHFEALATSLAAWALVPSGTEGYKKAEVMRGGVSTASLNAKTMESRLLPGLYFIGEVVDVTGWLGGYNFQWAWSSGYTAAHAILTKGP